MLSPATAFATYANSAMQHGWHADPNHVPRQKLTGLELSYLVFHHSDKYEHLVNIRKGPHRKVWYFPHNPLSSNKQSEGGPWHNANR